MSQKEPLDPAVGKLLDEQLDARPQLGDDALIDRVRSRVLAAVGQRRQAANTTVRLTEGEWVAIGPGVQRKQLWSDGRAASCMVRMEPGARFPAHFHPVDEECIVLEGSLLIEPGIMLNAGDFHVGHKGSRHEGASTQVGALLYVRSACEAAPA
jgi:anti-sigma factor ChrR (cupin superfamily)